MILIVDDTIENIYSLERLLTSKGFDVDSASSGEEALKKVLKMDYALIILDVQMPGMDGFEVAQSLAGFNKTKEIPIIFLSAVNTDKKFIAQGYASGGIDYVTKPVDPDILILKVKTFHRLYEQTLALNRTEKALRLEIEERKRTQYMLKERVDHLRSILESLPQIAFMADASGEIEFVNNKWFNYSVTSKLFPETHPEDPYLMDAWQPHLLTATPFECETRIRELGSNTHRFHLLRIIPIQENESVVKWVGTFTDIDDRKHIEKKKDEFLSIASHELKTPLTSIKAYVQLLERILEPQDQHSAHNYIQRVHTQLNKLNGLIVDLLDISKMENGRLKINKIPFLLEPMISNVVDTIYQTLAPGEFLVERIGDPIDHELIGDEIRVEQVLTNYLTNAIKYSPNSGRVVIKTEKTADHIKVSVTDFGIGIPKHKHKNIFDKFYRVEESSERFQGLGIGLYICAEIINQHQGTYGLHSAVGEGSTFYFTLPSN
ncbi:response regulator [Sphingobacterium sp. lm-10]|uniref:hybrid sensor histidine kinase/response regulator n=1 Tax=Sphingobacterium sp. lm-10 TaxID=2944904 RepID=UPI002021A968|nr:ATP-binding protein [Sphingobacterium sp. lm-10]MCL7986968.1 response regulator [Sphingobacterium sp. lm-10]